MTATMAVKILGLELPAEGKTVDTREVLERYVTLLQKNDPGTGGSIYIQSKVISAKEFLLEGVPSAERMEEEFLRERREKDEKEKEEKEGKDGKEGADKMEAEGEK